MGVLLNHEPDPQFKALHDMYRIKNPIDAARISRSWAITGAKRKKGMLKWTHSLAGRRFYRQLALHKAMHECVHIKITIGRKAAD